VSLANKPTSTRSNPHAKLTHALVTDFVNRCLNREERLVITLYYSEGLTEEEISAILDLPSTRAYEIREDVVSRLRTQLDPSNAKPILVA